ncbi:vitamin K epoxide reductase family protein [Parvularcula dongshanensis]|uniref:Nucleoside-diphosphate-sugar epimerase/type IV secretory pathway VirB2 component (Pilin) n=1 Tax=Parvularcula dongshanensis TaxID=1173995 RepID=A0A840I692_9PROT|nr:vitamin K epoxide reductase family protein [Parvularcula dongshanensis]MBB4659658.1 nucleoside-diphosphate-sugar epimerase/type IV secretory pathway VirB2 component (pilin) [Parvularcula dongshanensis]
MADSERPLVIITGGGGDIGSSLVKRLQDRYRVAVLDRHEAPGVAISQTFDLTKKEAVEDALAGIAEKGGDHVAAVIHLAGYFDFTGEHDPKYEAVNEDGTRYLLQALQRFEVERFVYAGTMLVHEAKRPGERIDEDTPLDPGWAYPESKAKTETIIREERGDIPVTLLHLAGLYDEETAVPTLSHQIARIYEKSLKSGFYSGDLSAGQAFLYRDDMMDAFAAVVDRREALPDEHVVLIGEREAVSYERLQNRLGALIHGKDHWGTLSVPKPLAKAAAEAQLKTEPLVPDEIDRGQKPFIRPFMIDLSSDHYALNTDEAERLLGWRAKHFILDELPAMIARLKEDPAGWYERNHITPPRWLQMAEERGAQPDQLRAHADEKATAQHRANLWAPFAVMFAGTWLLSAPAFLGYDSAFLGWSDVLAGLAVIVLGALCLKRRLGVLRWAVALVGIWIMFAPIAVSTPSAAAYLHGTLVGTVVFGLAVALPPPPGLSPLAKETGPAVPPGWSFNPSAWLQRLPVIVLAIVGLHVSRYLTAYQLGHIDGVWEPFFGGAAANPQNGTEEIITSRISEAWPVSDAGVGALTYMLEILTGLVGSTRRWRTMPWLVLLFGIMIVPLGAVSITFIIIQPILIGTWCTLCLIAAAAMLIQIPYSVDELVATCGYLWRKHKAGEPTLRILFTGGTDEGEDETPEDEFARPVGAQVRDVFTGGITLPLTLMVCLAIGIAEMFTRLTLGAAGGLADADHLIGAIVVTVTVTALAESVRAVRFVNIPLGLALMIVPFAYGEDLLGIALRVLAGAALIALSVPRGSIKNRYGGWSKAIV